MIRRLRLACGGYVDFSILLDELGFPDIVDCEGHRQMFACIWIN